MAFANERAHFGITMFPTDYSIQPVELARAVEERGFDSLFFPEHTHITDQPQDAVPGRRRTAEAVLAHARPVRCIRRVRRGDQADPSRHRHLSGDQRDPITLAKEIASVDSLSNGRFVLGIGAGWNREEMSNHGADYANRWGVVREKILAMKAIWKDDAAEFHGKFVNFDPIWSYPKPVQRGGPPVWIGANSKWVFDRVAEYADGWMPIGGLGSGNLERLKAACEARGRKVEDITLALFGAPTSQETLLRPDRSGVRRTDLQPRFGTRRRGAAKTGSARETRRIGSQRLIESISLAPAFGRSLGVGRFVVDPRGSPRLAERDVRAAVEFDRVARFGFVALRQRPGAYVRHTVFVIATLRPSVAVKLSHVTSLCTVGGSNVGDRLAEER